LPTTILLAVSQLVTRIVSEKSEGIKRIAGIELRKCSLPSKYRRKLQQHKLNEFQQNLVSNAHNFIMDTMSTYFRDIFGLPKKLGSTIRLYNSLSEAPKLANAEVAELRQFSSGIIYLDTGREPLFHD